MDGSGAVSSNLTMIKNKLGLLKLREGGKMLSPRNAMLFVCSKVCHTNTRSMVFSIIKWHFKILQYQYKGSTGDSNIILFKYIDAYILTLWQTHDQRIY